MWRPIPGWRPSLVEVVGDGLEALTSANPAVAVHFWAVWNGVDPPMEGSIRAIQDRFVGRVMFVACDADREENVRLCKRLGVVALPTLVVIASGRPPRLVVGYREPDALALAVEDALRPVPRPSWRFWGQGANAESNAARTNQKSLDDNLV
jgi:thioredoxin-like negative regulator of GroEL